MRKVLTKEAYERLRQELHELKTKERAAVAAAIAEAREKETCEKTPSMRLPGSASAY
jgi:transcription elongation GreA/GreB family factor